MLTISQLFVYPIKSLGGISVSSAIVTDRGFKHDRRWMLISEENSFLTLRQYPEMIFLKTEIEEDFLRITWVKHSADFIEIPFDAGGKSSERVTIWNAVCEARRVGEDADKWFSDILGMKCKLVYMPDESIRPVDTKSGYHPEGKFTSFADAYPFMMIGEASMDDLNNRLLIPVPVTRFRPNIVFSGGFPYQEDEIEEFTINEIKFTGIENCARCKVPNIDTGRGIIDENNEPLKTLAMYRLQNKKIVFGRNVVHSGTGIIHTGDELKLA